MSQGMIRTKRKAAKPDESNEKKKQKRAKVARKPRIDKTIIGNTNQKQPTDKLPACSPQQEAILNSIDQGKNVAVIAGPGTGKTTTIMHLLERFKGLKMLVMLYSSSLKDETRDKLKSLKLKNGTAHSYHSAVREYYDKSCKDDKAMEKLVVLSSDMIAPGTLSLDYDVILMDEDQDKTPTLHEVALRMIRDINRNRPVDNPVRICIFGDPHQTIFKYNNADHRYLTLSHLDVYSATRNWVKLPLSVTHRLPRKIADFLNHHIFHGKQQIVSYKEEALDSGGSQYGVFYHKCNLSTKVPQIIMELIDEGYSPSDIFVLCPTNRCPSAQGIANVITSKRSDIHMQIMDNEASNTGASELKKQYGSTSTRQKLMQNKLVFMNYHKVKGLERKVVIMLPFDQSIYRTWRTTSDKEKKRSKSENTQNEYDMDCPNEIYVAMTRAMEKLILIQRANEEPLPFIDMESLRSTCDYTDSDSRRNQGDDDAGENSGLMPQPKSTSTSSPPDLLDYSVTKIVNYIMQRDMNRLLTDYIQVGPLQEVPCTSETYVNNLQSTAGNTYEALSAFNGIIYPAYYEYKKTGRCHLLSEIYNKIHDETYKWYGKNMIAKRNDVTELLLKIQTKPSTGGNIVVDTDTVYDLQKNDFCLMAVVFSSLWNRDLVQLRQMVNFDWLTYDQLDSIYSDMCSIINSLEGGSLSCAAGGVGENEKDKWTFELPVSMNVKFSSSSSLSVVEQKTSTESRIVSGSIDMYCPSKNVIVEWKATRDLSDSCALQVAMYGCMLTSMTKETNPEFQIPKMYLCNILTGESCQVSPALKFNEIVADVLRLRLREISSPSDEAFLAACYAQRDKYVL